ncbi:MAG TPA: hypothetical protein VD811_08840 [Desulfuromonadales bacterium]|nr:hypothetical protein [Desulfuromonadales bacterium]
MQRINEPVRVGAVFGPGSHIRPVWFDWRRRKYEIGEVTYRWHEREGATAAIHFTVIAGGALYELVFDTGRQTWVLAGQEAESP